VLDTSIRKQTQITQIRHAAIHKQLCSVTIGMSVMLI